MDYLAYFAAGAFLANGIPHFVNGISGKRFQSPFARPPGVGESAPVINVFWGLINLIVGWLLLTAVGDFDSGLTPDMLALLGGFTVAALMLGWYFGRIRSEMHQE